MEEVAQPTGRVTPPAGMCELKLDDRQRLKLPAVWVNFFNSLKETTLFITSLDDRIARIYPMSVWKANQELLYSQVEEQEDAETVIFTADDNGATVEMDSQGRITIPQKLRELLKMDGQGLHLSGFRSHAEVMTDEVYKERKYGTAPNKDRAARKMNRIIQ